jgi:hypothetical protein
MANYKWKVRQRRKSSRNVNAPPITQIIQQDNNTQIRELPLIGRSNLQDYLSFIKKILRIVIDASFDKRNSHIIAMKRKLNIDDLPSAVTDQSASIRHKIEVIENKQSISSNPNTRTETEPLETLSNPPENEDLESNSEDSGETLTNSDDYSEDIDQDSDDDDESDSR